MKNTEKGLNPIVNRTMADEVEDRLREYFKEQGFKPGDVLPKETSIAESLGVSRNVVREALSRFRMLGMIESKKKRGMVLAVPNIMSGLDRMLEPNWLNESLRGQLFELRLILEIGLADLIFMRKKDNDIVKLKEIIAREEKAESNEERVKCDIEFHSHLYKMTGNDTLRKFQKLLLPVFDHVLKYESENEPILKGKISHKDLLETIKSGTPGEFRKNMREHLTGYFNHII